MEKNIEIRNDEIVEVTPEIVKSLSNEEVIFKRDVAKNEIKNIEDDLVIKKTNLSNLEQIILNRNIE